MPLKLDTVVSRSDANSKVDNAPILKSAINAMVKHHIETMKPGDTTSGWVSKAEVEELIAANSGSDGIRIYFGRHDPSHKTYPDRLTVILVATKKNNLNDDDLLKDDNQITTSGFANEGDDDIPLCPARCQGATLPNAQ